MKRFRLFLAFILFVSSYGTFFVYAESAYYNDFKYEIRNNSIYITDCNSNSENIVIPDEINGLPVTTIDEGAFSNLDTLKSITIPDSVTRIHSNAFADCTNLVNVVLPDCLTAIEENLFYNCQSLEKIHIPEYSGIFLCLSEIVLKM